LRQNLQEMNQSEILQEIDKLEDTLARILSECDELGGGSPLEWIYERLEELEQEYKIRLDFPAQN